MFTLLFWQAGSYVRPHLLSSSSRRKEDEEGHPGVRTRILPTKDHWGKVEVEGEAEDGGADADADAETHRVGWSRAQVRCLKRK